MGETIVHLRPRRRKVADATLLTSTEVTDRLKVSIRSLRRWVATGSIPHVRLGPDESILRFPADLVDEWWRKRLEGGR